MRMRQRMLDRQFWVAVILGALGGLIIGVTDIKIPAYGWVLIWLAVFTTLLTYSYYKVVSPVWHMSKGHYRKAAEQMTKLLGQDNLNPRIRVALLYNLAVGASRLGDFEKSKIWLDTLHKEELRPQVSDHTMTGVIHMLMANNLFMTGIKERLPVQLSAEDFPPSDSLQNEKRNALRLSTEEWEALQALFSTAEDVGRWMEFLPMVAAIEARQGELAEEDIHAMLATYIHSIEPSAKVKKSGNVPLLFDELTYNVINPFYIAIALIAVGKDSEARQWMLQAANCKYENVYTQEAKRWLG